MKNKVRLYNLFVLCLAMLLTLSCDKEEGGISTEITPKGNLEDPVPSVDEDIIEDEKEVIVYEDLEEVDTPVTKDEWVNIINTKKSEVTQRVSDLKKTLMEANFWCVSEDNTKVHAFKPACSIVGRTCPRRTCPSKVNHVRSDSVRKCGVLLNGKTEIVCGSGGVVTCPAGYSAKCTTK